MWPFSKKNTVEECEKFGDECLEHAKSIIAQEKEHYVNSAEELASKVITFAVTHNADKICLSRGYKHTIFGNYNSFECNFMHDSKWYIFIIGECNNVKGSGGLRFSAGPADDGMARVLLPKIQSSKEYIETGKFNSGFFKEATIEMFDTDNLGGILKFCKEYINPILEKNSTLY